MIYEFEFSNPGTNKVQILLQDKAQFPVTQSILNLYRSLQVSHTTGSVFLRAKDTNSCSRHDHNFPATNDRPIITTPVEMMRRYEGLPNFRLHENIWYSDDATNITTDQGWALTWDVNKLKNLHANNAIKTRSITIKKILNSRGRHQNEQDGSRKQRRGARRSFHD